jgi:hypothetical protein
LTETEREGGAGGGRLTAAERYRSAHGLATLVIFLLAAYSVAALLSAASSYMQIALLERAAHGAHVEDVFEEEAPVTDEEASANDLRELAAAVLQLALFLACVVAYLLWIHRAYRNLPALGNPKESLGYSPGWAVGSWFIPFVNLVVPYRVVRETWEKSDPSIRTRDALMFAPPASAPLVVAWWLVWIVSNVVNNLAVRFASDAKTPADLIFASKFDIASNLLNVVSAVLAILVVREIDRRQEARSREVVYAPAGPPPPQFPSPRPPQS